MIYNNGIGSREGASPQKETAVNTRYQLQRRQVQCELQPAEFLALQPDRPVETALLFAHIERFLNEHLYRYATEIGELEVRN